MGVRQHHHTYPPAPPLLQQSAGLLNPTDLPLVFCFTFPLFVCGTCGMRLHCFHRSQFSEGGTQTSEIVVDHVATQVRRRRSSRWKPVCLSRYDGGTRVLLIATTCAHTIAPLGVAASPQPGADPPPRYNVPHHRRVK
jgi:hypothetical protein